MTNEPHVDEELSSIRALVRYGPSGPEILELASHVGRDGPGDDRRRLLRAVTADRFEPGAAPFGAHDGTVYRFDDGIVVHVPGRTEDGERCGLVATLESDDGRSSTTLLKAVRSLARPRGDDGTRTGGTDD